MCMYLAYKCSVVTFIYSFVSWSVCNISIFPKGCAMSGLIADAKTLIDKARVETQVQIRCATIACYSVFILYKSNLLMCPRSESLVHLQRDNDGGKCDPGCVQPGAAVWGGGRRSWCHGQSLTSTTNTSHPTTTTSSSTCFLYFSFIYSAMLLSIESTIWSCTSVRWSWRERPPVVSKGLMI